MKSFKEYLTESKKVYEFKLKVAGQVPKDFVSQVKAALAPYKLESCSSGKGTPIQEAQEEFPSLKNIEITVYDVVTSYPATSLQVKSLVAEAAGIPNLNLVVRTLAEQEEYNINHAHDVASKEALLNKTDMGSVPGGQDMVGEKHAMSFLQELNKEKHGGTEYTGVNPEILSKGLPKFSSETPGKQVQIKTKFTNLFAKTTHTDPIKGTK